jgi:hypothetical protein
MDFIAANHLRSSWIYARAISTSTHAPGDVSILYRATCKKKVYKVQHTSNDRSDYLGPYSACAYVRNLYLSTAQHMNLLSIDFTDQAFAHRDVTALSPVMTILQCSEYYRNL